MKKTLKIHEIPETKQKSDLNSSFVETQKTRTFSSLFCVRSWCCDLRVSSFVDRHTTSEPHEHTMNQRRAFSYIKCESKPPLSASYTIIKIEREAQRIWQKVSGCGIDFKTNRRHVAASSQILLFVFLFARFVLLIGRSVDSSVYWRFDVVRALSKRSSLSPPVCERMCLYAK